MWTNQSTKKNPLTFKTTINNLINKTFGTHKQTHKHMAGKRWQGGKDGAMIKKRRFGCAVGFILIHILPTICVMYSINNIVLHYFKTIIPADKSVRLVSDFLLTSISFNFRFNRFCLFFNLPLC